MIAMSARQHRTVIILLCFFAALLVSLALSSIPRELGMAAAHAQVLDAGSGSAIVTATPALPDPSTSPADFFSALKDAKTHGWPLAILVGTIGLLELAAAAGKKKNVTWLAWFGKGRVSVVIGGGVAILTAGLAALTHAGSWSAAFVAMALAGTTYWHQAGTDPAKG